MTRSRNNYKKIVRRIAKIRMDFLFEKAHETFPQNKMLANRYCFLARKYAQRARIRIPSNWKKRICHHCKNFLYPSLNCRIRLHSKGNGSHVSLTCLECNHTTRYFIKTKNSE